MPLALLLEESFTAFRRGVARLAPWNRQIALEELLVDRARGAFMRRWFGPRLPLEGLSVRIAIANLDAFRARYAAVRAASQPQEDGVNLTEPLLGLTGMLAGTLLSPAGAILAVSVVARYLPLWLAILGNSVGVVLAAVLAPAAALLIGTIGLPVALAGATSLALSRHRITTEIYELMGSVARLIDAVRGFLAQLLGPREEVRNPLIRSVLGILDRLAGLVPHLLGFLALLVVRVGPMLRPLAAQVMAFRGLIPAVWEAIRFIFNDAKTRLLELFGDDGALFRILDRTLGAIMASVERLMIRLEETIDLVILFLRLQELFAELDIRIWAIRAEAFIRQSADPAVQLVRKLRAELALLSRTLSTGAPPSPPSPPSGGGTVSTIVSALTPPFPNFPSIPPPGDVLRHFARPSTSLPAVPLPGGVFVLTPEQERELERVRRPRSVFGAELRALRDSAGRTPQQQLAALREEDLLIRALMMDVVNNVLPPAVAAELPQLDPYFRLLDEHLYGVSAEEAARPLPVRELPESDRLRPVVRHLRIVAPGHEESAARAWTDRLQEALRRQPYLAPAGP